MSVSVHRGKSEKLPVLTAYYAVLVLFLLSSFFPQYRLWGVNWWAYFPAYVPFVLFAIGAVAPVVMWFAFKRRETNISVRQASVEGSSRYFIIVFFLIVLFGLAFYLLRARTHFLGDGYTVLSLLTADNPLVKSREIGEALVHIWLKSLIGGEAETAALLSFQVISISAGVLFLIAVAFFSRLLVARTRDRILFFLGLASSGYMLLFFGYVENYSLFVFSVGLYSLTGLLVAKGKLNRWLILLPLAMVIFFHVFGVTLIPSAAYLLVANSKPGDTLSRLKRSTKLLITLFSGMLVLAVFYHFYSTDYFFRFAIIPIFAGRFTVEGYTLFSLKHLVDYFNLLLLLLPGLPLVAATLLFLPLKKIFRQREYRYLLILLASTLGAVFVFDPKLGMPRDWDLFSFCGVPLAVLGYYLVLENQRFIKSYVAVSVLSIMLSLLSLLPRAVSQVIPEISVAHFKNYYELDKAKNRNARRILIGFYEHQGDDKMAQLETQRALADFPERQLVDSAVVLIKRGRPLEAVPLLSRTLEVNALYADAWLNLGKCYAFLQRPDQAIEFLQIANGLNPYNAVFLNYLGSTYLLLGDNDRAEKALRQSISLSPSYLEPMCRLVQLYAVSEHWQEYYEYFGELTSRLDSSPEFFKVLGDFHLNKGDYKKAGEAYVVALQKGLDTTYVKRLMEKHPQLKQRLLQLIKSSGSSEGSPLTDR